jgi:hypothetical protein
MEHLLKEELFMIQLRITSVATFLLTGILTVFSSGQGIDLKGKVVTQSGAGIGNAVVTLVAAKCYDTTDASGAFRIIGDSVEIKRNLKMPGQSAKKTGERNVKMFNLSGRLIKRFHTDDEHTISQLYRADRSEASSLSIIRIQDSDGFKMHTVIIPGGVGESYVAKSVKSYVAATKSIADTLLITRTGYRSRKVPVTSLRTDMDTLQLQELTDTFEIRKPIERTLSCSITKVLDCDILCDCENDSLHASIYVQTRPESCGAMSAIKYKVENAWIMTSGGIEPLQQVIYDAGGNHYNDRVTFLWNNTFFSFYHSSFSIGWRACSPLDCMQICKDAECRTILYDGCKRTTCENQPSLKVRCVKVETDGTVPERIDWWTYSSGDVDYQKLPCRGDVLCK